jgi:hypothetical protein
MDPVKHIDKYIIELLFRYECVILPGFGGFITKYAPASVSKVDHRFDPPSKSVRFNASLKDNDGLLVNHVASREGISYEEARQHVENFSFWCRQEIMKREGLRFFGLGEFMMMSGSLVFHPKINQNLNEGSFGLAPVNSPPINRKVTRRARSVSFDDRKPRRVKIMVPGVVSWTIGMAIPVIVFLLWGIINPAAVNQMRLEYSGLVSYDIVKVLFPFNTGAMVPGQADVADAGHTDMKATGHTDMKATGQADVADAGHTGGKAVSAADGTDAGATDRNDALVIETGAPLYYIIGGSFRRTANAELFSSQLEATGFDPYIIPVNKQGNIRVSYGVFTSKKEALKQLRVIRDGENEDAWMLKN